MNNVFNDFLMLANIQFVENVSMWLVVVLVCAQHRAAAVARARPDENVYRAFLGFVWGGGGRGGRI